VLRTFFLFYYPADDVNRFRQMCISGIPHVKRPYRLLLLLLLLTARWYVMQAEHVLTGPAVPSPVGRLEIGVLVGKSGFSYLLRAYTHKKIYIYIYLYVSTTSDVTGTVKRKHSRPLRVTVMTRSRQGSYLAGILLVLCATQQASIACKTKTLRVYAYISYVCARRASRRLELMLFRTPPRQQGHGMRNVFRRPTPGAVADSIVKNGQSCDCSE